MIDSIVIENFKSVEKALLPMGRVTVLIGENGGGKTNILEALGLLAASSKGVATAAQMTSIGLRACGPGQVRSAFGIEGQSKGVNFLASLRAAGSRIPLHVGFDGSGWRCTRMDQAVGELGDRLEHIASLLRQAPEALDGPQVMVQQIIDSLRAPEGMPEQLARFAIFAPEAESLRTFRDDSQLQPLGARGEGLFRHLQKLQKDHPDVFTKIVENMQLISWVDGLDIPTDLGPGEKRLAIRDRHMLHELDQRSANEGFLFLLFIFTLMWSPETPAFFAIDNVDEALNPKLCREAMEHIVKIAKETDKQVILTTHNPALLDGLNLNDPEQVLVAVSRNSDGRTRIDKVPPPRVRKGSQPVRLSEAFLSGYLGGLPSNF